jgi:hypothetical protein
MWITPTPTLPLCFCCAAKFFLRIISRLNFNFVRKLFKTQCNNGKVGVGDNYRLGKFLILQFTVKPQFCNEH